jgi:hypothetical protein
MKKFILDNLVISFESIKLKRLLILRTGLLLALPLLLIVVIANRVGVEPSDLTRDPNGVYHYAPYVGSLTFLGIFFWIASVTICFVAFSFLKNFSDKKKIASFFLYSGLLTLLLVIDDTFEIHEIILEEYMGFDEYYSYAFYLILFGVFAFKYIKEVFSLHVSLLMVAFAAFGISVFFDLFLEGIVPYSTYLEDGFKLSGIVFWMLYFAIYFYNEMKEVVALKRDAVSKG